VTTREIYFKNVYKSDVPLGMIFYICKDKDGIIQIGKSILAELRTDETTVKESIKEMRKVEKMKGFMFWTSSEEGEQFFKENREELSKCLSNIILNQK